MECILCFGFNCGKFITIQHAQKMQNTLKRNRQAMEQWYTYNTTAISFRQRSVFWSTYFEGDTQMLRSSCLKRGATSKGLSEPGTSLRPNKRLTRSSSLKCSEQTSEWIDGSHFSRFR